MQSDNDSIIDKLLSMLVDLMCSIKYNKVIMFQNESK